MYTVYVPEYISGLENFIFGLRLEGDNKLSVLFKGEGGGAKIFIAAYGEQMFFFTICFQFQEPTCW